MTIGSTACNSIATNNIIACGIVEATANGAFEGVRVDGAIINDGVEDADDAGDSIE